MPPDPECFSAPFRILVGPHGDEGEESFDVGICNPVWIERRCQEDGFLIGRHLIVVPAYDAIKVVEVIEKLIRRISGDTWEEIGLKLARYAHWEFEDYQDAADEANN